MVKIIYMNRNFKLSLFSILFVFINPSALFGLRINLSQAKIISWKKRIPIFRDLDYKPRWIK